MVEVGDHAGPRAHTGSEGTKSPEPPAQGAWQMGPRAKSIDVPGGGGLRLDSSSYSSSTEKSNIDHTNRKAGDPIGSDEGGEREDWPQREGVDWPQREGVDWTQRGGEDGR